MFFKKKSTGDIIFATIIYVILTAACIVVLYPLILIASQSFSDPFLVMRGEVKLLPKGFNLKIYQSVLQHSELWNSYKNTIIYTFIGTAVSVSATAISAYPLSRKDMYGYKFFNLFAIVTMFISGGMIPLYLQVSNLNLINSMWSVILPSAISTFNLIVMKSFYSTSIPSEINDAAAIDGCNDIHFFVKIVLPLSSSILAVMVLFYGVRQWNSWVSPLLYLVDRKKYPLQLILREILLQNQVSSLSDAALSDQIMIGETIKYAVMVVSTIPILCLYPFLQKYFVKGVMMGALKG
ncbi:MAG: carbohydrate ABC transporter permease [Clostridia bacterium]|nr:carbohydrate ABC transporter permease [Clostridia bacterium]